MKTVLLAILTLTALFALARAKNLEVISAGIVGEKAPEADIVVTPWPSDHRATVAKIRF
jgi:exodeoxyribonuclease-3